MAAVAMLLPSAQSVAQTVNTYCQPGLNGAVNCSTTQQQQQQHNLDDCISGGRRDLLGNMAANGRGCTMAEINAANARVALRKQVGSLLAGGQCEEAVKAALEAGDFELAEKAKGLCITPH